MVYRIKIRFSETLLYMVNILIGLSKSPDSGFKTTMDKLSGVPVTMQNYRRDVSQSLTETKSMIPGYDRTASFTITIAFIIIGHAINNPSIPENAKGVPKGIDRYPSGAMGIDFTDQWHGLRSPHWFKNSSCYGI